MPLTTHNYGRPHATFRSETARFALLSPQSSQATAGPVYTYCHPKEIAATTAPGRVSAVFCSDTPRFKEQSASKGNATAKTTIEVFTPVAPEGRAVVSSFRSSSKRLSEPPKDCSVGYIYDYKDPRCIGANVTNQSHQSAAFASQSPRLASDHTPTSPGKKAALGPDPLLTFPSDISQVVSKAKSIPSSAFHSATRRFTHPQAVSPVTSYLAAEQSYASSSVRSVPGAVAAFRSTSPRYKDPKLPSANVNPPEKYPTDIAVRVGSSSSSGSKPSASFASKSKRSTDAAVDAAAASASPGFIYDTRSMLKTYGGAVAAFRSSAERFKAPKVETPSTVLNVRYPTDIAVTVEECCKR